MSMTKACVNSSKRMAGSMASNQNKAPALPQALFLVRRKPRDRRVVQKSLSGEQVRRSGWLPCVKGAVSEAD